MREQTDLRLGIEADFIPGREDRMAELLAGRDWDYVLGSIHFLGDGALDYDRFDVWTRASSPDAVWRTYFEWLGELARSGMFDVLAHPDLVKHWGAERPRPSRDPRHFYEIAMEHIADSGIAVEVSTAGLRKPVGEIYPDRAFLEMVLDAGNPIVLSSDAARARPARVRLRQGARPARGGRRHRAVRVRPPRAPPRAGGGHVSVTTGIGWDSHRLVEGRPLILGGVTIPHDSGLAGHSDADVLTHAVIDALLGAAALGDIGQHFPDTDERFRGADSLGLLRLVVAFLGTQGFAVAHVDATVVMERPKLAPHRDAIRERLAFSLAIDRDHVNVKASTGEGMGFVGRGEGVAALAVATLRAG